MKRFRHVISKSAQRTSNEILHGHVFSPASRAYYAYQEGWLDEGQLNQREAGKFFPLTSVAGVTDSYARDDVTGGAPPPMDGQIASANQGNGLRLDAPGSHWSKHPVNGGEVLQVSWHFSRSHKARRWNYFITKTDWDPNKVLAREQFILEPFYTVQNGYQPYWGPEADELLYPKSPTTHQVPLPQRKGYHVLLAVWEVADTDKAFYQVVDLDFGDDETIDRPPTPTGLTAFDVTSQQVKISWNKVQGNISYYQINRNGLSWLRIDASVSSVEDTDVQPDTTYNYSVLSINSQGIESLISPAIHVKTPAQEGDNIPPYAPPGLHIMGSESTSIWLMWSVSTPGSLPIKNYVVFRDGILNATLDDKTTDYNDSNLTPSTSYDYLVAAVDINGEYSPPSAISGVTKEGDGALKEWQENIQYYGDNSPNKTPDEVNYKGKQYHCLQQHTSNSGWSPEATVNILWKQI